MKIALVSIIIALSALVVVQWVRESSLHTELSGMDKRIHASEAALSDLEDKLKTWEAEIQRLTENATSAAKKEKELQAEIARLTMELTTRDAELKTAAAAPPDYAATMQARNEEVTKQNEAIQKANASIQKLVQERDALITKLNARTKEWNELTEKYNKLAKSR
jgi:peptidoglycan hydrolase CwlO-like protein